MQKVSKFTLLLLCLLLVHNVGASNKVDSLNTVLVGTKGIERVKTLSLLSNELKSSNTPRSLELAKEALSLASNIGSKLGIAISYLALADVTKVLNKNDIALNYYHKSLGLYIDMDDEVKIALIYFNLGVIHKEISNYDVAIEYFNKSADFYKQLNDDEGYSRAINALGTVFLSKGEYTEALKNFLLSLKLAEKSNNQTRMAQCYNNIGNIHLNKGELNAAMEYYQKSLAIKLNLGPKANLSAAYGNIGTVFHSLKQYDSALVYFNHALKLSMNNKDKSSIAKACANIGLVYSETKQYQTAIEFLFKSLEIEKELGNKKGVSQTYNYISTYNLNQNKYDEAIKYAKKGLDISLEIEAKEQVKYSYNTLALIYESMNDYKTATKYYKLHNSIKDSIVSVETNKQAYSLEAKYKSENTQKEIELLKQERALQRLKLSQNRTIIYSALILLVLALVLTFVILQSNRQKQRTNELLRKQNDDIRRQKDEKDVMLKEIHHRVKNNLQIINSLMRLQANYVEDKRILDLFDECQNRVISMALIHEQLYESKNLSGIEIRNYIETLTNSLLKTYRLNVNIALDIELEVTRFGIDTLIPLGLLINEVLSNSLKYAFEGKESGKIIFKLKRLNDVEFELLIGDDGVGLPDNYDISKENPTLGLELIKTFVQQLEGTIEHLKGIHGTLYKIVFKSIKREEQF